MRNDFVELTVTEILLKQDNKLEKWSGTEGSESQF
jgi:hypothetical protein